MSALGRVVIDPNALKVSRRVIERANELRREADACPELHDLLHDAAQRVQAIGTQLWMQAIGRGHAL